MSNVEYLIPVRPVIFEEEIKKSRFITRLAHTPSIDSAKAFVAQIKEEFKDARHNCWAFVAGAPQDSMQYGFSDDGEPSGTAGKPMLNQLIGSNVGEISAVVTRYFGGTKLGTGGLVKAYGGGIQQALVQLQTQLKVPETQFSLQLPFDLVSLLEYAVKDANGSITERQYHTDIVCRIQCPVTNKDALVTQLINQSKGRIALVLEN